MNAVRTCVFCRKSGLKRELLRFVLYMNPTERGRLKNFADDKQVLSEVFRSLRLDISGMLDGRGAYCHPHERCLLHRKTLISVFSALLKGSDISFRGSRARVLEKMVKEEKLSMCGVLEDALGCVNGESRLQGRKIKAETFSNVQAIEHVLSVLKKEEASKKKLGKQFRIRL